MPTLHVIYGLPGAGDVPLDECKRRVRERNVARPAGLYFGDVSDGLFDQVVKHIVPPTASEGFHIA
jgi:hypothetical protein